MKISGAKVVSCRLEKVGGVTGNVERQPLACYLAPNNQWCVEEGNVE